MLLNNKETIREKLNNNSNISLNKIPFKLDYKEESKKNDNEFQYEDNNDTFHDLYTTSNIILDTEMVSSFEYSGIPSKSSILGIKKNTLVNMDYSYCKFNKIIPENNFEFKIMIYTICNQREIPFLLYLLNYNENKNKYSFLNIDCKTKNIKIEDIIHSIFKKTNINVNYSGVLIYKNINYLFFEYSEPHIFQSEEYKYNYVWGIITEIINYNNIYNIKIDNDIIELFLNNNTLLTLTNIEETDIYESPNIGYSIKQYNYNRISTLYFNDYHSILKFVNDERCIDRYAILLGSMKLNKTNIYKNIEYHNNPYINHEYNSVYNLYSFDVNQLHYLFEVKDKNQYFLLTTFEK